ncbi:MAG: dTDP-4-dehydrorhamnose 3,5-epimerase [Anaerolineales bacterium]|nr:dTDP-4-dehydrorhamnose 3,5-epimerase [Anaerolineales bacterium]
MRFLSTTLSEVVLIEPEVFTDERGFFMESYHDRRFAAAGIPHHFVQDNHAASRQGVLRGLHYQVTHPQGKLIRVISGEVYDAAVDLRRSSATFGLWVGARLSAQDKRQLWVPPGFAHGYYVLSQGAEVIYKVTDYYDPEGERTLLWNDPQLDIAWPLIEGRPPILSTKDTAGVRLDQAECYP